MSGIGNLAKVPREIRNRIYFFVGVKPESYIGEADVKGVKCIQGLYNAGKAAFGAAVEDSHFSSDCRDPVHEDTQIIMDFGKYRYLNFALTCRTIYQEFTEEFYFQNGFEFHHAHALNYFLESVPFGYRECLRKIRFVYRTTFRTEWSANNFQQNALISAQSFKENLWTDHLDWQSQQDIKYCVTLLRSSFDVKDFELIYRFDIPGVVFNTAVSNHPAKFAHALDYKHVWHGEPVRFNVCMKPLDKTLDNLNAEEKAEMIRLNTPGQFNDYAGEVMKAWNCAPQFEGYGYAMLHNAYAHYTSVVIFNSC
jgi:hypothetical protein